MTEILLSNLHFSHYCCVLELTEERADRLTWLEVDRTVLDLYDHVVIELSVERYELKAGLHSSVRSLGVINECTPHNDTAEWLYSVSKHVCSVCMCAAIVLRTRLSL